MDSVPADSLPQAGCLELFRVGAALRQRPATLVQPLENTMQGTRIATIAALSVALGCTALATGCASTPAKASLGEDIDDSVITAKVKAAFVKDAQVSALDIGVETFKGTVQLSGFVDNSAQQYRAGEVARGVKGVREVKNNITVK